MLTVMKQEIIITINNSYSQITGLDSVGFNALRKVLSYNIDSQSAYFSNNQFHTRRYLIDTKGYFPTGLIRYVYRHLDESLVKFKTNDERVKPKALKKPRKINLKVNPYKDQLNALKSAVTNHFGTLSLPTGTGKSLIIALIAAELNVRTLIVVPNLSIKAQLQESFGALFPDMSNITIENIDSAALETARSYDCLIIDEAHHSAATTYQKLNKTAWAGIYYRFFFTATPFRNNQEENMLFESICGDLIYKLSYKQAVSRGYIVPLEAYYVELPKRKSSGHTWRQVYDELVINNHERNEIIAGLIQTLSAGGISTLCLVKEIAHGNTLSVMTAKPFVNGQDDTTKMFIHHFNSGKFKALIGTTGVLGEGVDSRPAEYIIAAGLGKAKSAFMQWCGRGVRKYPGKESAKLIIFKDKSHKFTIRHFNEQCKILLEEYGVVPLRLDV